MIRSPVEEQVSVGVRRDYCRSQPTYSRMLGLFSHDRNAFYDGCSGIVDAIEERLKLSEKPIR